jgi:hypothetical protein
MNWTRKLSDHDDVLTSLAAALDLLQAQNMASAALVRVLSVKCALVTDNWRTFLSDLQESATLDLESLPVPVEGKERRDAIRVAALDCLAASMNDLVRRLSTGERCGLPRPGDWDFPDMDEVH